MCDYRRRRRRRRQSFPLPQPFAAAFYSEEFRGKAEKFLFILKLNEVLISMNYELFYFSLP